MPPSGLEGIGAPVVKPVARFCCVFVLAFRLWAWAWLVINRNTKKPDFGIPLASAGSKVAPKIAQMATKMCRESLDVVILRSCLARVRPKVAPKLTFGRLVVDFWPI